MGFNKDTAEVYRLYDAEDQLLYVGVSNVVERRLRSHSFRTPTGSEWWPLVAYCALEFFPIYHLALESERAAIRHELPIYNRRSVVRHGA